MSSKYRSSIVEQLLDQQVRFAPRERKIEQVDRAEKLFAEIQPERTYTYEYLCFRITDYRPDTNPQLTISGEALRHDLPLFIEGLSNAANISIEEVPQQVHTVEQLSRRF